MTRHKDNLYEYASQQQGFFTTKQAEMAGYQRNHHSYHVKSGNWIREMRGIYRLAHYPQDDEDAQLVLWYLWTRNLNEQPQGVYSHDTALRIYELSDLMPTKLHMTVSAKFRRLNTLPSILVLWKGNLDTADICSMRGFAVTTPRRTLLDIISSGHLEDYIVEQAFSEALAQGMLPPTDEEIVREALLGK